MVDQPSRQEIDAKIDSSKSDMKAGIADLRAEFAGMRKDFAEDRTANVKWMVALAGASVAILGSWISIATKAPAPALIAATRSVEPAPQPPVIIYLPSAPPPGPVSSAPPAK